MGMLKEIIGVDMRKPTGYSTYKTLMSAKEIHDFKVKDINFTDVTIMRDYEDKIVNLILDCTEVTEHKPSFDTYTHDDILDIDCPIYTTNKKVALPGETIKITFPVWEDQLKNIFYLYSNHRVLYDKLLIHYSEILWNGFCETPMAHINKFKIDEDNKIITLWRFYTDMIDSIKGKKYGYKDYLHNNPGDMIKIDMNLSDLTPISITTGNYGYVNNVVKKTYTGISDIPAKTADISFDANIDKNVDRFNQMVNDSDFVKMRIPNQGELLEVFLKEKYSKDTSMSFSSTATKITKRDVRQIEMFNDTKRGHLERVGDRKDKFVLVTRPLLGSPLNNDGLVLSNDGLSLESFDKADLDLYVKQRYDHTEIAGGNFYIYFKEKLCEDATAIITAFDVPTYAYTATIPHDDIVSRTFRIDETTPFVYDAIKNNYIYTFDYGKEIDDSEDLDWSVPAESLMNAILYAKSENNVITIISLVKLGGTRVVPTGLVTISGHYHWTEIKPIFNKKEYKLQIRDYMIQKDEEDKYCVVIPYDTNHPSVYNTEKEEIISVVNGKYQIWNTLSDISKITTDIKRMINSYYIDEKKKRIYVYIDTDKFEQLMSNHPFSRITCNFNYNYNDEVIYKDVVSEDIVPIGIKFIPQKDYECVRKEVIDGIEYYVYNFYLYYNFKPNDNLVIKKDIVYDEFYSKSMVYDVVYNNGTVDIYLLSDILYSDIKISFYLHNNMEELDHITIENYETYTLTGKAYDKFITLVRDSVLKYEGIIGNSPKYDINY